jgi:hypothetical protein
MFIQKLCTCLEIVFSASIFLELSVCKVYQPCEVILEWIKVCKVCWSLGAFVALQQIFDPLALCGAVLMMCVGDMETPSLVGDLLSGDDIKVTKGLGECLYSRA